MVGTIVPVVHGKATRRQWAPLGSHMAGAIAGGAAVGAAVGALGGLVGTSTSTAGWSMTGAVALVGAAGESDLLRLRIGTRRQVTQRWRRHLNPSVTSLLFGVELGAGVTTFVPVTTFYVLLVGSFTGGDPRTGAAVMALFGAARAAPVALIGAATRSSGDAARVGDTLPGWEPVVHLVNALLLAAGGAYLLSSSIGIQ